MPPKGEYPLRPLSDILSMLTPEDRVLVERELQPYAFKRKWYSPSGLISNAAAITDWHRTPEGWNFWRAMHNRYVDTNSQYHGCYEKD